MDVKEGGRACEGGGIIRGLGSLCGRAGGLQIQLKTAFQAIWQGLLEDVESAEEISNAGPEADNDDEDDNNDNDRDNNKDEGVDNKDEVEVDQPQQDDYFKGMDIEYELTCK